MTEHEQLLLDRIAIENALNTYARACDGRDWTALASVFTEDVAADYAGEYRIQGRDALVDMVRSMLGGCGPTQHLLGNFDIGVNGDHACCACYVRAIHAGTGDEAETYYEVWAEYRDTLRRTGSGWRIAERNMVVHKEVGSRTILKPAP